MTKQKRSLWLKIVLAVSLALNLLVAGVVTGALIWDQPGSREGPGIREQGLFSLIAMLPREDRREFRKQLANARGPDAGTRASPREWNQQLVVILRADPFDAPAFRTHLSDRRARYDALGAKSEAVLSDMVSGISTERRLEYADRLERSSDKRRKPRGH